jgi:hypothetical protein
MVDDSVCFIGVGIGILVLLLLPSSSSLRQMTTEIEK